MSSLRSKIEASNFVDLLQIRSEQVPGINAYRFLNGEMEETESLTFGELDTKSRAVAGYLQAEGLSKKTVLLLFKPGLAFITAFFGCLYAGSIPVPAYPPRMNRNMVRLHSIISDAQAQAVLTDSDSFPKIDSLFKKEMGSALTLTDSEQIQDRWATEWKKPSLAGEDLAFLQYTSGSTGNPKGVMVSHSNLLHNEEMISLGLDNDEDSLFVSWLPVFHDMGLIGKVLQSAYLGASCVLLSPVDFLQRPYRWLQAITHYQGTTSGAPNFAYELCVNRVTEQQMETLDLSSWRLAFNGAEPVKMETLERFVKKFASCGFRREAFYPCYGMAEATLFISGGRSDHPPVCQKVSKRSLERNQVLFVDPDQDSQTIVGCGHAWLSQKIEIVDPHTLQKCPDHTVGEIWVSGESVAQGYWRRPEQTRQDFHACIPETGEGPFFRTGDLGYLSQGELYVTGRLKDLLIIRGRNHYPQDIEHTVENSHEIFRSGCSAAFTVEVEGDEKLVVAVEVDRGYWPVRDSGDLEAAAHREAISSQDILFKVQKAVTETHELRLHDLVLIKERSIPKTSSGKIQRNECRRQYLKGEMKIWGS